MAKFVDVHTHVQFAAFQNDWKEVIDRAFKNNVWLVNVGTQLNTSRRAVEMANMYPEGVYATVGLHPIHTEKSHHDAQELGASPSTSSGFTSKGEEFDYAAYKALAEDPKVVAVGECGLDYYRLGEETKKKQAETFIKQIELAKDVRKPLMVHCRQSFADLINLLSTHYSLLSSPPGIIHFFSGTKDDAKKLLDMGFSFTFGGVITFTRDYDEVIKLIPTDRILSETDAPYVTPEPYRRLPAGRQGKRNEPLYVIEVVEKLAELKGVPAEEMERQTFENARKILSLK